MSSVGKTRMNKTIAVPAGNRKLRTIHVAGTKPRQKTKKEQRRLSENKRRKPEKSREIHNFSY